MHPLFPSAIKCTASNACRIKSVEQCRHSNQWHQRVQLYNYSLVVINATILKTEQNEYRQTHIHTVQSRVALTVRNVIQQISTSNHITHRTLFTQLLPRCRQSAWLEWINYDTQTPANVNQIIEQCKPYDHQGRQNDPNLSLDSTQFHDPTSEPNPVRFVITFVAQKLTPTNCEECKK